MTSEQLIRSAITGLIAAGVATAATPALAAKGDTEKCAGIANKGN